MRISMLLAIWLLISACASQPPQTLDEKLEGQTPAETKELLRRACLNEAEWERTHETPATANTVYRIKRMSDLRPDLADMTNLCRKMDTLTDAKPKKKYAASALLAECETVVQAELEMAKYEKHYVQHAERLRHICRHMTGLGTSNE